MSKSELVNLAVTIKEQGAVAVMPTDTILGLCCSALKQKAVARLYQLKGRPPEKPFIILIHSWDDLGTLGIKLSEQEKEILAKHWPGPLSVVLPCLTPDLVYLHRGTKTLAIRWPKDQKLQELLAVTGPLIATSANPSGQPPALNVSEAKEYFGSQVDFYLDQPPQDKQASTLVKFNNNKLEIIRQGTYQIKPETMNIDFETFSKMNLQIGTIKTATRVEGSDKLLKLAVDLGEEKFRQIIAGIGKVYEPETLVETQALFVTNLEPRLIMGQESQGMILAAGDDTGPILMRPDRPGPAGANLH